jgi:hypothetical protein
MNSSPFTSSNEIRRYNINISFLCANNSSGHTSLVLVLFRCKLKRQPKTSQVEPVLLNLVRKICISIMAGYGSGIITSVHVAESPCLHLQVYVLHEGFQFKHNLIIIKCLLVQFSFPVTKICTVAVCKVRGLILLLRVGTLCRCGDGLFFDVPPLANDAFLQRSTYFSKTCCRPLITSKFLASELPFHGLKSPEIA